MESRKEESKRSKGSFIITKKIAKHGSQAVIVIPKILQDRLCPGTVAEIKIDVLPEVENEQD